MEIVRYNDKLPQEKLGAKNSTQTKYDVLQRLLHIWSEPLQCLPFHFEQLHTEQEKKPKEFLLTGFKELIGKLKWPQH